MDSDKTRKMPGWEDAPIPVCYGGDARALAFCCKYIHPMPPGYECTRDEKLAEIGLSRERFIEIKEQFSRGNEPAWDAESTCYGSLAYCCMRSGGCVGRDAALQKAYPGLDFEAALNEYFSQKKKLAELITKAAENGE